MDLSELESDEPDGWVTVELMGETHRLGYQTPDPLEIASVERDSSSYRAELFRSQQERNRILRKHGIEVGEDEKVNEVAREQLDEAEFEAFVADLQTVRPPDPKGLEPRVDFIAERVVETEPVGDHDRITYDGEEDWQSIPKQVRVKFIRRLGRSQIWDAYDAITEDEGLDEDEKKS